MSDDTRDPESPPRSDGAGADATYTEESIRGAPVRHGMIGPYRLLEKVGEGGMGEVWLAEQQEPVRRKVALKVVKRGMDTAQVVARFEAERQALALMDHPAIAKVLDGGATPHGRPYFVMDFVRGEPITTYCDRQKLATRERLDLFMQVCDGVQHAHHKGIIHRDLKPSNILVAVVDGKAQPKIIDFGVAKATGQRLTEKTMYTAMGLFIGTPDYMSPEQAEMSRLDVDTRTDIYSLGVILYELLVGSLPFDPDALRASGFDDFRRRIREVDPPRPSTRVTSLGETATEAARKRRTEPSRLAGGLKGDLDWITMKALEKDRTRRYASPAEFAADIGRHLRHEPVLAGPPSTVYRARKFARRHRIGVSAFALAMIVLVAFAATMTVQARRIARARTEAEHVSTFLTDLFKVSDPSEARGKTITAREILDRGTKRIESELAGQPGLQARLLQTTGTVYENLGLYADAEPLLERSLSLRRRILGEDHPDTLAAANRMGILYWRQGRFDEAEALHRETLEARGRVLGESHPDTLTTKNALALVHASRGRYEEAESLQRETLEARRRVLGDEHPDTLKSINNLAVLFLNRGRLDDAEPLYVEAARTQARVLGDGHPDALRTRQNLAIVYWRQGRHDQAERTFAEILETQRRVLGDEHPDTLMTMGNLAFTYQEQGRVDEAEPLLLESLATRRRKLGDEHPDTLMAIGNLATLYSSQQRHAEAEPFYLEALEAQRRVLGDDHPDTLLTMGDLALDYLSQGRRDEAERLFVEALEAQRRVLGEEHPHTLNTMGNLALAYLGQGRGEEAARLFLQTLEAQRRVFGEGHPATLATLSGLVDAYGATGDPERTRPHVVRLLASYGRLARGEGAGPEDKNAYARLLLTCRPEDLRDPEEALTIALESVELTRRRNPEHLDTLALAYHANGRTAEAIRTQREAIALLVPGVDRSEFERRLAEYESAGPTR